MKQKELEENEVYFLEDKNASYTLVTVLSLGETHSGTNRLTGKEYCVQTAMVKLVKSGMNTVVTVSDDLCGTLHSGEVGRMYLSAGCRMGNDGRMHPKIICKRWEKIE